MTTAVRLTGSVQSSRKYSDTAGNAVHELLLTQGPLSLPFLVRRSFGPTPSAHMAACSLERTLRPGQAVTVTGRSIRYLPRRALLELLEPDHAEQSQPLEAAA